MLRLAGRLPLFLALAVSCARMGAPSGGLPDTEPPAVAEFIPAADSTGVAVDAPLAVIFSEEIRREQIEKLVSLSPPAGRLRFEWEGRRLGLRTAGELRPGVTYRLTVDPGVTDLHGVKSTRRFTGYFSTGITFSPGRLAGTVTHRDSLAIGALLFAAPVGDTSLVFRSEADSSGRYLFPYLPLGEFGLRAFLDRNRNNRYDFTREPGAGDTVTVGQEPVTRDLRLVQADTTAPFLSAVETPDSLTIVLVYDDPLDSLRALATARFALRTPDREGRELPLDSLYLKPGDPRRVVLRPEQFLVTGESYHLSSVGLVNQAGLVLTDPERGGRSFTFRRPEQAPAKTPSGSAGRTRGTP